MFIDGGGVWRVVELLFVKVLGFELCVGVWKVFYELNFRVVDEVVVNWVFVIDMFNFFFGWSMMSINVWWVIGGVCIVGIGFCVLWLIEFLMKVGVFFLGWI